MVVGLVVSCGLLSVAAGVQPGLTAGVQPQAPAAVQPRRLDPVNRIAEASAGTVYLWTSKAKGIMAGEATDGSEVGERLRYTWALPPLVTGASLATRAKALDLVTLVHGDEQDVMWGHDNYPPGSLGEDLISVAVDGTTDRDDGTRLFAPRSQDVVIFRDFVLELSRTIRCRRIIHYGLGEGGLFATIFGGRFPALCNGIIAHNSGAGEMAATSGGILGVPIVLLAGTDDERFRIGRSLAAREEYVFDKHAMVFVHILPKWQDQPCPAAVRQGVDLCVGMTTDDPAEALERAERLMELGPTIRGKPVPPALHMARAVLRRVDLEAAKEEKRDPNIPGGGMRGSGGYPKPFKAVDSQTRQKAIGLAARVEGWAQTTLAPIRAATPTPARLAELLAIDGKAEPAVKAERLRAASKLLSTLWLLREELRGIDAMETLAGDLKLDERLTEVADAGDELVSKLAAAPPASEALALIGEALLKVAGYHSLPADLAQQVQKMVRARGINAAEAEKVLLVQAVLDGFDDGVAEFAVVMGGWKK